MQLSTVVAAADGAVPAEMEGCVDAGCRSALTAGGRAPAPCCDSLRAASGRVGTDTGAAWVSSRTASAPPQPPRFLYVIEIIS
eukprot:176788-Chlamydomonas_euryale.AAC.1